MTKISVENSTIRVKIIICIAVCLAHTTLFAQGLNQKLVYSAFNEDKFEYSLIFTSLIQEKTHQVKINTTRTGQKFMEENETVLDDRNNVLSVVQLFTDYKENEVKQWSVDNSSIPAKSQFFNYKKEEDPISFYFPTNGHTFHSLMYILQTSLIIPPEGFEFNFLIPPANFYSMTAKVIETELLQFQGQERECLKLEVSLNNPLSLVMPKIYFWITTSLPHLLLKYKDYTVTAFLEQQILLPILDD